MEYQFEMVGKIGSMALIRKEDQEIDYNIISRLGADLKPGIIWVTSGATEIGRLDYIKRTGHELYGDPEQDKTDYSAQGQAILMQNYRQFIRPEYGVRQILVEHTHFNDPEKREHIRQLLIRAAKQRTIPITMTRFQTRKTGKWSLLPGENSAVKYMSALTMMKQRP